MIKDFLYSLFMFFIIFTALMMVSLTATFVMMALFPEKPRPTQEDFLVLVSECTASGGTPVVGFTEWGEKIASVQCAVNKGHQPERSPE